ncbi:MAG: hypothetical protein DME18_11620 [Verrucomicrobia bacterium]|nr:MAG: hypothetical protein DME18_11620 [Verrucomicrobiota bacterium]
MHARFASHLFLFAERHMLDPVGRPIRPILLKERFPANAVRIAHQRQGPAFHMRQNGRRNSEVILDELRFDDVVVGKQNLGQIRKLDFAFANLGDLRGA